MLHVSIYGCVDSPNLLAMYCVEINFWLASLISGAIDDIINQIKGGKFTLRATEVRKMICSCLYLILSVSWLPLCVFFLRCFNIYTIVWLVKFSVFVSLSSAPHQFTTFCFTCLPTSCSHLDLGLLLVCLSFSFMLIFSFEILTTHVWIVAQKVCIQGYCWLQLQPRLLL